MATLSLARAATTTSKPDTIPTEKLTAVLGAFSACNLASSYIERGNFTAARRKLVLALRDLESISKESEVAA